MQCDICSDISFTTMDLSVTYKKSFQWTCFIQIGIRCPSLAFSYAENIFWSVDKLWHIYETNIFI